MNLYFTNAETVLFIDEQAPLKWKLWFAENQNKDAGSSLYDAIHHFLKNRSFHTESASRNYNLQLDKRLLSLEQKTIPSNKEEIEEGHPLRGVQTFFKSNYRNHINLSAIADNKANIMISVNSILISVLITVLTYQSITSANPKLLFPVVIFIVCGLTSLTFAVLAARPKVTSVTPSMVGTEQMKKHLAFFGNFTTLKLDQYEDMMDEMLKDSNLIYSNMTRDLYFLGRVLSRKYNFLRFSYNVFMLGFLATVMSFMWAFFS